MTISVPCQHCGRTLRRKKCANHLWSCNRCKRKVRLATRKKNREKNREEIRAYDRQWRADKAEHRREYLRRWRQAHLELCRARGRKSTRRFYWKQRAELVEIVASVPCLDCGMLHTAERRHMILRRMLPCTSEEIHAAWNCIWGPSGLKGSAGSQRLRRDLKLIGAQSLQKGEYYLPRRAA